MALLMENQIYDLSINTTGGMYQFKFATKCQPLYSSYEQLLLDTGLTPDELNEFDALRVLYRASLMCNDILERTNQEIPDRPTVAMREYTRYRAALDVVISRLRSITYKGRESVSQRLDNLAVDRRPAVTANELQVAVRNLEREVAYWEARLRERYPIASAVRGGEAYPYPLAPRGV
jgi:hypothetical protein